MKTKYKYYVYELLDPRGDEVFYVGKGCRDRIYAHEKEAKKGVISPKCDRIREIWDVGLVVVRREVARFLDEASALAYESERIGQYQWLTNSIKSGGSSKKAVFSSPPAIRCVAWWLRVTNGGKEKPAFADRDRPWSTTLRNLFVERGHVFVEKAIAEVGLDGLKQRLRPLGINLVMP